jgi:hypothetical protein
MKYAVAASLMLLFAGCKGAAEGPMNGVLVVYGEGQEAQAESISTTLQRIVATVDPEPVFSFSYASMDEMDASLRLRRTVLMLVSSEEEVPGGLEAAPGGYWRGHDVWARGQSFFAAVPGTFDAAALSRNIELAYNGHLEAWIYQSFVSTSMSSTARIDSLRPLGFFMDIPRSYQTAEWRPDDCFLQFQRPVSEEGMMLLSICWKPGDSLGSLEDAIELRQWMARRFFYDASADSIDMARLGSAPWEVHGLRGWFLLGEWRNPEHLNAGAFTSYVLQSDTGVWILDTEVYNPGSEKEPYIREGWLVMNTFSPEG